jgi:hypothetical protein
VRLESKHSSAVVPERNSVHGIQLGAAVSRNTAKGTYYTGSPITHVLTVVDTFLNTFWLWNGNSGETSVVAKSFITLMKT